VIISELIPPCPLGSAPPPSPASDPPSTSAPLVAVKVSAVWLPRSEPRLTPSCNSSLLRESTSSIADDDDPPCEDTLTASGVFSGGAPPLPVPPALSQESRVRSGSSKLSSLCTSPSPSFAGAAAAPPTFSPSFASPAPPSSLPLLRRVASHSLVRKSELLLDAISVGADSSSSATSTAPSERRRISV